MTKRKHARTRDPIADDFDLGIRAAAAPVPQTATVEVPKSEDAGKALALVGEVQGLAVIDKASHQIVLEYHRSAKLLKRNIEEHWAKITRGVDALKRQLLDYKAQDLAPVDRVIAITTKLDADWKAVEEARVEAEEARRYEAEQARLQREAERLETEALKLEATSAELSAREARFVYLMTSGGLLPAAAAEAAGYKHPTTQAERLLASAKIRHALSGRRAAEEKRQEAELARTAPIETAPVERQTAKVAGVRATTHRSAEVVDFEALLAAFTRGEVTSEAFLPNTVFLNKQAQQLGPTLQRVYPGVRYVERKGLAG